jgi:hypothetical protein
MLIDAYERFIGDVMAGRVPFQSDIDRLSDGVVALQAMLTTRDYEEVVQLLNEYA